MIKMISTYGAYTSGNSYLLSDADEAQFVSMGIAAFDLSNQLPLYGVTAANGNTVLVGADGNSYSLFGPKVFTVGVGGYFATLADAIAHITTLAATNLETLHTGTYTYADGLKIIIADQTISTAVNGKQLFLKHAADAFLYPIEVQKLASATNMIPWLPLYGRAAASTGFSIVSPQTHYVIVLLPGRHEVIGSLDIPPFVTIKGYGKFTSIVEGDPSTNAAGLLNIPGDSTFVELSDFGMLVDSSDQAGTVIFTDAGTAVYTDGRRIRMRNMHHEATGQAQDCIWQKSTSNNVLDDLFMYNVSGKGWYDIFAILHARNVRMDKCEGVAVQGPTNSGAPQGFNLAQNELCDSMFEVTNSNFVSYNPGNGFSKTAIGGKVWALRDTTKAAALRLAGNVFKQSGEPTAGAPTVGLETSTVGIKSTSPNTTGGIVIHSSNNLFSSSGADLNFAFDVGEGSSIFSANDRNYNGTAVTNRVTAPGALTVVL